MKKLLAIALFVIITLPVGIAAAGEFPAGLEFLKELRVIFRGECVVDERNNVFIPCQIRARNLNAGQELFYMVVYQDGGRLYGIDSFRITDEKVILAVPMPE